jgi:ParB-like nuclease domain
MSKSPAAPSWAPEQIDVDELYLDPRNARLSDFGLTRTPSQTQIIDALWTKMAVDELALSIAENGFYKHEPLYATREHGRLYVVEGNRRLAAVKLLREDDLRRELKIAGLPTISAAAKKELNQLPVIICERDQIWAYLGFKHINGPQAWESYPKAHYIAWVHNELGVSLEEIARRIGDKHSTVSRLYDALMVLEQAESARVFDREDRYREHFSFSHLTTGLGYAGIQSFLGLPTSKREIGKKRPVPRDHVHALGELLLWLYGSESKGAPPIIQSQNPDLRMLNEVVGNKQAVAALRKGLSLSIAVDISKGDDRVFRESLVAAKQNLQRARGTVLTGYDGNEDLLNTAEEIVELARSVVADMVPSAGNVRKRAHQK